MDIIEKAVRILQHDGLVIYPTDTIYGLGGDAFSDEAIEKVYEVKHRPPGNPISIAVSDIDMLRAVARVDRFAEEFIGTFLPGPVTVVLEPRPVIPDILTGGSGLIGVRIPAHEVPVRLVTLLDSPITATSANLSGAPDPTTPGECGIVHDFLIDGGKLPGTPSTVVDLINRRIIRPGADIARIRAYILEKGQPK